MKAALTAQTLRIILIAAMLLLVVGGVAGFFFAQQKLQEFAATTTKLQSDTAANNSSVESLQQLESTISQYDDVKEKANNISTDSSAYPVGVIDTVTRLGKEAGITFKNVSFVNESQDTSSEEGVSTLPQDSAAPQAPTTNPEPAAPTGLTKRLISVTPPETLEYTQFLQFLEKVESSAMYLQVTKLSFSKNNESQITVQPFEIEVYVKQ